MCMCMLTKRAQILFDEEVWKKMVSEAKAKNISVGGIVRQAIEEKYAEEAILERRRKAIESTLSHRPKPFKGKIDYKALINEGREAY